MPGDNTGTAFHLLDSMTKDLRADLRQFQENVYSRLDRIEADLRECATKDDLDKLGASIPTTETIRRKLCDKHHAALESPKEYRPQDPQFPGPLTWRQAIQHPGYVLAALAIVVVGLLGIALISAVWNRDAASLFPYRINPETGAPYVVPITPDSEPRPIR